MKTFYYLLVLICSLSACSSKKSEADAYGNFESKEILVSAEASGKIVRFDVDEGQSLIAGQTVGYIDTIQLKLKKDQLNANVKAMLGKAPNIPVQIDVLSEQIDHLNREKKRTENLIKADAATQKQLDDINTQIDVLKRQVTAQASSLGIQSRSILNDVEPLKIQVAQTEDQIQKSILTNPINGVVLAKYAEEGEITSFGKPLYRIADLSTMILRAYVTGDQLAQIKIGQTVNVLIDQGNGQTKAYKGTLAWISGKAEFTPKTIQTKDERVNLVYAIKIQVPNDGSLKIGMPGEVAFASQSKQ